MFLAKNFLAPEDSTSKKFSDPGACSLHPTRTATTKAHKLWLYTCDLQIWGRWGLPFGLQGWLEVCASLHAAACATCHVRRAPLKSTKSRVRQLGLSTLKIWGECPAPFSRQTPESSTDRQTDGRQKMPTYPPCINLRNTKNLQMLKHMNFLIVFLRFWKTSALLHPMRTDVSEDDTRNLGADTSRKELKSQVGALMGLSDDLCHQGPYHNSACRTGKPICPAFVTMTRFLDIPSYSLDKLCI